MSDSNKSITSWLRHFLQQSWLLIVSSFCFGLLIAVTDASLRPVIEQNKINKLNRAARALLVRAKNFVPLDQPLQITVLNGRTESVQLYKAVDADGRCVGWSFNATGAGFADKIELVVVVDGAMEKIVGFDVLVSNETPGFGDQIKGQYFRSQFAGAPLGPLKLVTTGDPAKIDDEIVAITGATISSEAVVQIISNAVTQVKQQMLEKELLGDDK